MAHRDFIGPWVEIARDACTRHAADADGDPATVEQASIRNSIDNLKEHPWIAERLDAGTLSIHGWWFDLHQGVLHGHEPETGAFSPL